MSESELDFEMADATSPEIIEISSPEVIEVSSPEVIEVCSPDVIDVPSSGVIDVPQTMSREDIKNLETFEILNCLKNEQFSQDFHNNADDMPEFTDMPSPEMIELPPPMCSKSNEDKKLNTAEIQYSYESDSELEEGEIKECNNYDDCNNTNSRICRHFQSGTCWLGQNCRFLHVGGNTYKNFDSSVRNSQSSNATPMPVRISPIRFPPETTIQPVEESPDSWDNGLRAAKRLLLSAKQKKEADLDFEEKQLYQGLGDNIRNVKDPHKRKAVLTKKHRKGSENCSRRENPKLEKKTLKKFPDKPPNSRNCMSTKSRIRSRSHSWSPARLRRNYSENLSPSSFCSECKASCDSPESKINFRKTKSKLERVFSRTLDAPETSRSRKTASLRRGYLSHSRRRSESRHSFIKRFIYRPYSRSPRCENSKKHFSKISPPRKTRRKRTPVCSQRDRSSPFSKILAQNNIHRLESCSSDMTVSSINCTSSASRSRVSSIEIALTKPSQSAMNVSKRKSNVLDNKVTRLQELENSHTRDIKKWLETVPKSTKENEYKSTMSKKVISKTKVKNSKPVKDDRTVAKPIDKQSSCSNTTDEELSAAELELLKYIPNKNRCKPVQVVKKTGSINVIRSAAKTFAKVLSPEKNRETLRENPSTKTTVEHLPSKIIFNQGPSKIIFNHGSIIESLSPKLVSGSEKSSSVQKIISDLGSGNESPAPKTPDHGTNAKHNFFKESENTEQNNCFSNKSNNTAPVKSPSTITFGDTREAIPNLTDENRMKQTNDHYRSNEPGKRRSSESSDEWPLSSSELELLKYVSIRHPGMSKEIRKKILKNPPLLPTKKAKGKSPQAKQTKEGSCKSVEVKKVRTNELSRREQLIQQLEAVELAIAKKKEQVKLECVKMKEGRI